MDDEITGRGGAAPAADSLARCAADGRGEHCPHIDQNDFRCGHRFTLGRMEQAFSVCFGAFHGCPIYHRLTIERAQREQDAETSRAIGAIGSGAPPVVLAGLTRVARQLALRATGT